MANKVVPKEKHPNPLCIQHGKPITWEDPECEICKELKEGITRDKIGADHNYRPVAGRGEPTGPKPKRNTPARPS